MAKLRHITSILLNVVLGLTFVISGLTKLLPIIETFEFSLVEAGVANWVIAPFLARFIIGIEMTLGVMLIGHIQLKRWTLPATLLLLVIFTGYLIIQYLLHGNSMNCGCFGETLPMSTLWALAKNVVLIGISILSWYLSNQTVRTWDKLITSLLLTTSIVTCFIVNPIDPNYTTNNLSEAVDYPLQLELLYEPEDSTMVEKPLVDLRKGKHVVAFMSLQCGHCRIAAKKMRVMYASNPALPFYLILNGEASMKTIFFKDTRAESMPHSMCLGKTFVTLGTTRVPRIYLLEDGMVRRKVDMYELNQQEIEAWINEP